MNEEKHVVIVGAGFAGLNAARSLGNRPGIRVTVIDRRNHHLFQPLLYQVAMAAISPADIAVPIRSIVREYDNIEVILAPVLNIDRENRKVICDYREISYDYLILACGATHSYFGRDDWEENAPGLKSIEEATEIRRRVFLSYELAEREESVDVQKEHLTFIVVGGGPTGVELAGALGEISRYTLESDFRNINPKRTRIILIEAGPRILPAFDADLSEHAARELERLGVTIWTNTAVTEVRPDGVIAGGENIRARTVLWAAGVLANGINRTLGVELDRQGRVIVEPDLSIPGSPEVFVVGDQASFSHTADGKPLPGLAPVAIQQGRHVARNIIAENRGKERKPFVYFDKGIMATIGRTDAVVQTGRLRLTGLVAWLMWIVVHIAYLISFRNRVMVLFQWGWSYFNFRRGARLIRSKIWKTRELEATLDRQRAERSAKSPRSRKTASATQRTAAKKTQTTKKNTAKGPARGTAKKAAKRKSTAGR